MRLSMMFDCWKKSCHSATVVPTMAMISSTEVELTPSCIPGTTKSRPITPQCGWERKNSGMVSKFANTNTNIDRSQLRKLPLAVIAMSATGAIGTAMYLETPK